MVVASEKAGQVMSLIGERYKTGNLTKAQSAPNIDTSQQTDGEFNYFNIYFCFLSSCLEYGCSALIYKFFGHDIEWKRLCNPFRPNYCTFL